MHKAHIPCQYFLSAKINTFLFLLFFIFCNTYANAATYNLSTGNYPPCNNSWSVSGTTYTCTGNGNVTLAAGDVLTSNTNITISANNGFSLNNNTIGSSSNRINLVSTYGAYNSSATTNIWGNVTSDGVITLAGTTVNGTITTNGNISLTGGGVTGLVTSNNNTITTNGTNLSGGATAQSGMSITGGTLAGNFVMTSNNVMTLSGVTMTSGSIAGASTVTIQSGSVLGSASSSVSISSTSGAITVNNSIVYGSLTAPDYSTVNVTNGGAVYGTCSPGSTPANACSSIPPSPMNCPAGIASGITGSYYNNRTLTEPSSAARSDAPIDFNWGGAAPGASGINADNFSVRWSGYVHVTQSGNYRFLTISDDGVRLYINGNLVIDRWNVHSATTDTTGNISLVAGQAYTIVLEYYENGGEAVIGLQWRLPGSGSYVAIPGGPTPTLGAGLYECVPETELPISSCPTTLSAGITGDYFNNRSLTAPVTSRRSDGPINFDWSTGAPGPAGIGVNNFSVRWDGYVRVTQSGIHRFQINSDDGVRLTVNGNLLIDQWNDHAVTTHTSGAVNLVAGNSYPIKLEYYENGGFSVAQLLWQTPGSGTYIAIPRGSSPISAAGLYECVNTPSDYLITHNATGITCAAEPVTVTALDASGVAFNPPTGTEVALATSPASGVWVGGNIYTFTGSESGFTKYLRQTTPAALTITASSATAINSSNITFVDTVLRIALNSALENIPTQVAGSDGDAIAKVISTNPETGVCEAKVASATMPVELAFSCNNPISCISSQLFTVNNSPITANDNAAPVAYNNVNLVFNASGEAPMTINYSDVGQVTLHGRLTIPESGNDPELTISTISNAFVVKPYTLAVTGVTQTASPSKVNLGTTSSGDGFIPAGEKFTVSVQSRNALGVATPNFGNEMLVSGLSVERNKIQLQMGCPERDEVSDPVCATIKPDYPTGGGVGNLVIGEDNNNDTIIDSYGVLSAGAIIPGVWNEVGSFRLEPSLSGTGYLGQGNVPYITPSGVIGRFYPDQYTLLDTDVIKTCAIVDVPPVIPQRQFHYMGKIFNAEDNDPNTKGLVFKLRAVNKQGNVVSNYDPAKAYNTAAVDFYTFSGSTNYSTRLVNNVGAILTPGTWVDGVIDINHPSAQFGRAATPDGPYTNITLGIGVKDCLDKRFLLGKNLTLDTTANCGAPTDNAYKLTTFDARYGRLRLDDAFGPETANLPVNFATEFWVGSFFVPNMNDSCTKILRSAISYPAGNILEPANLTVQLSGGTTTGVYGSTTTVEINFTSGSGQHSFLIPSGNAQGEFNVDVDLASYPWLRFDWNQDANYSDTSLPTARFGFGSYRGHDRVIYWRERF